jgi:2-dehydro-3-deoxyglucarate aldolase
MNRLKKIQEIRDKLEHGDVTIGSWIQIGSSSIAEIMGNAGYDWIAVDMEHGSMSTSQLPDLFRALELNNTLPLVRLSMGHFAEAKYALDAGAGGIIIPMVESAQQLQTIINHSTWPPSGIRGIGFSRANLYGKNFNAYREEAIQPFIVAQIEHIKAVNDIENILAVQGLDAIIIGPYDLSASMGTVAQFDHPDFVTALARILKGCDKMKKPAGLHIVDPDPEQLNKRICEGYQFIAYSIDSVFMRVAAQNPLNQY